MSWNPNYSSSGGYTSTMGTPAAGYTSTAGASSSGGGWGAVVGSAISAYAGAKQDQAAIKAAGQRNLRMTDAEAKNQRDSMIFDDQLAYYDEQRMKMRARQGLNEFRKFANVATLPPNYKATYSPPVMPNRPVPS